MSESTHKPLWLVKVFMPVQWRLVFRADIGAMIDKEKAYRYYNEQNGVSHGSRHDEQLIVSFHAMAPEPEIEQWLKSLNYLQAAHLHPTRVVVLARGGEA